jgi:uncharacterized membrane protein YbhN (UPF0104 family)
VGHNEALAASLVWRFLQFVITIATGLIVICRYGAGLKDVLENRKKMPEG